VSDKTPSIPVWWKNTYFLIAALLFIIGTVGLALGTATVRDPGQRPESNLSLVYYGAAVIMFVNGWLSHKLTVQHYYENVGSKEAAEPEKEN